MPELPDVHAFRKYLDSTALHRKIARTRVLDTRILDGVSQRKLAGRLKGAALKSSTRHGKYLFVKIDSNGWLVLHFGMTGELHAFKDRFSDDEDVPRFTRMLIEFADGGRLAYCNMRMLGRVGLTDDLEKYIEQHELGPDALDDSLTADDFLERASGRSGTVKALLMNQSIVAGVGNEYSDEILFQQRLHPSTKAKDLDEKALRKLFRTMRRVLSTASKHLARTDRFPRTYLLRERDEDGHCPRCGTALKKVTVSGRTSRFCPKCQRRTAS